MKPTLNTVAGALSIAALAGVLALPAMPAQLTGTRRTDLQQHDLSIPGRQVIQARVDIDPGKAAPKHRHPGEEIVYVLEGRMQYQLEGQPPVTLREGDVLFIPAGVAHSATNVGSDNAAELATYVVEKGKPLVELVD